MPLRWRKSTTDSSPVQPAPEKGVDPTALIFACGCAVVLLLCFLGWSGYKQFECDRLLTEAVQLIRSDKDEEAIAELAKAERMQPNYGRTYLYTALAKDDDGKSIEALQALALAVPPEPQQSSEKAAVPPVFKALAFVPKHAPPDPLLIASRAALEYEVNDHSQAITDATTAYDAGFAPALKIRALSNTKAGRFRDAIADCTMILDASPDDDVKARMLVERGFDYSQVKNYAEALADLKAALALHPNETTYLLRADIYRSQGSLVNAIRDCTTVLKSHPDSYAANLTRGLCEADLDLQERALHDFDLAIACNDQGLDAIMARAGLYLRRQQWDQAARDYQRALSLNESSEAAREGLEKAQKAGRSTPPAQSLPAR